MKFGIFNNQWDTLYMYIYVCVCVSVLDLLIKYLFINKYFLFILHDNWANPNGWWKTNFSNRTVIQEFFCHSTVPQVKSLYIN